MKKLFFAAFAAFAVLAACQREELAQPISEYDELNVSIEEMTLTKTCMDEDNKVLWSDDDRIVAFMYSTLSAQYKVKSGGKPTASFAKVSSDDLGSGSKIDHIVAYYPYSDMIECEKVSKGYSMNVVLPAQQAYVPNSFGNGSLPMASISADNNITFCNVSGAMKLQLKGTAKVASVKVEGKNSEKLSGAAIVTVYNDGSKPSISMSSGASTSVLLDCGDGVQLNKTTATELIISIPPVIFSKGFTVTITDTAGSVYTIDTDKRNEVKRSSLLIMPQLTLDASHREPMEGDYIDEYGINHGQGVEIDGTVWAPVNCGYHATDFKYGKLYQWGRKYGQGYSGNLYDKGSVSGTYSDASSPMVVQGPVSLNVAQSYDNKDYFYIGGSTSGYDWISPRIDNLWNLGTDEQPLKTEYDPCPDGWRVPTRSELDGLRQNNSYWVSYNNQGGYWFSGATAYSANVSRVFFPSSGTISASSGNADGREHYASYFSSMAEVKYGYAYDLYFRRSFGFMFNSTNRASAASVRCVKDATELIEVSSIAISTTSLSLTVGQSSNLSANITPSDANHQTPFWYSSNEAVATVDKTGTVTALAAGAATITAVAGMQSATCEVVVVAPSINPEDYIDEYGINHGPGVEIDGVIWAPVNCGYHETDFKYGKLYQWGRKYGQGYDGNLYDSDGIRIGDYSDAKDPKIRVGSVLSTDANVLYAADVFYTGIGLLQNNWCYSMDSQLWNSGTEEFPVKTENDPCPSGWRVPTTKEAVQLRRNQSGMMADKSGILGKWLSGENEYAESVPKVFLPATGFRHYEGEAYYRGCYGGYWTSKFDGDNPSYIGFSYNGKMSLGKAFCAHACAVRCVKDETDFVDVSSVDISTSSISLLAGQSYELSATVTPSNSTLKSVSWYSSDVSVAVVDANGKVTGVSKGDATIIATSGACRAICDISVKDSGGNEIYYIDENGVNRGKAVKIGETVWAPVNCGYHDTDYKYGKMYQWGRKHGQGFNGDKSTPSDGYYLQISDLAKAFDEKYVYYFFRYGLSFSAANELSDIINWNFGTEESPVKTQYDPCPMGWRVPTLTEFEQLIDNHSSRVVDADTGITGMWFSGSNKYSESVPRVFLPAAGNIYWTQKNVPDYRERDSAGSYFTSSSKFYQSQYYEFGVGHISFNTAVYVPTYDSPSGYGRSVRCVKE